MSSKDNFKRGSVVMLVLTLLTEEDMYGYQISQLIEERSDKTFLLPEGSLYPTLYKLEEQGYISDKKVQVGKRMTRVYYHIEEKGMKYLTEIKNDYFSAKESVEKILNRSKGGKEYSA